MSFVSPVATEILRAALERAGELVAVRGVLPATVTSIADDSRQVGPSGCFVAVRGADRDGHAFLPQAQAAGASCAMIEAGAETTLPALVVRHSRIAAAVAAAAYYGEPARSLRLVGVTGTNGKSTTVGILRHLLDEPAGTAASIGTLGVLVGSEGRPLPGGQGLTTPGPVELQRVLRALVEAGVTTVAMECSSHALDQDRVRGIAFDAAVFTNLTRDHLDYHGTMEAYRDAKARLVALLGPHGVCVANADDRWWDALPTAPRRLTFGLASPTADIRVEGMALTPRGSTFQLVTPDGVVDATLPLLGDFNVANALGAVGAAVALGVPPAVIAARLATTPQVSGRLEVLSESPLVLRDYAHTPDAYERVLTALRPYTRGRIILVFGCGGDRDRGKRPLMSAAAHQHADHLIITDDNPRTEDPARIIDDIVAALPAGSYDRIPDRRAGIAHAIALAHPTDDLVLLVGKGPDTYQLYGTTKTPFDELLIVQELLAERAR